MPVRSIHSPKLWTCVEHLLKEEDEHVCVLPMTTLIKPVRVITLVQIDTTATAAAAGCPPGSANLEPCKDLDLDLSTGSAAWTLIEAPAGVPVPQIPAPVTNLPAAWTPLGAPWLEPAGSLQVEGWFTYELPFRLCCAFSNAEGEVSFRTDNEGELFLNGQSLIKSSNTAFNDPNPPTLRLGPEQLKSLVIGDNKFVMKVRNYLPGGGAPGGTGFAVKGYLKAKEGAE